MEFDWEEIKKRYTNNPISHTKNGRPFRISRIDLGTVYIDLPSGEQIVSRKNLEKAVRLINKGAVIVGPSDYKRLVYDERPTYAWAILRDAKIVK
jgi:hypothetical protein